MGSTSMLVASVNAVPNAPIAVAKAMAPEATKAGPSAGSTTSRCTAPGLAPRARGFCEANVKLLHRGHDGEDHARNREIEIAEKQPVDRIGKYQFFAEQAV